MLLNRDSERLILEKQVGKVLKVCPAYDGTFVLVATSQRSNDEQRLVHVDSKGSILWQRSYAESIDTFGLFNHSEIIVLNVLKNQIEIIDLKETQKINKVQHEFAFPDTSHMQIHTFYDTRLLCIQETGLIGESQLILTYYSYSSHELRLVSRFKTEAQEWTYGNCIAKANNHSKIVWWKEEQFKEEIVFHSYELSSTMVGTCTRVKFQNKLSILFGNNNSNITIADIWQSAPGLYMLPCTRTSSTGVFREFYVIDAANSIIREAKFTKKIPAESTFIHFFNLGQYSILYEANYQGGNTKESLVYFIDNAKEEIIQTGNWVPSSRSHFYVPGYDSNIMVEAIHDNSDVREITVITSQVITLKEMYLHFLLHVNEDFDDDLLQDTMDILGVVDI